MGNHTLGNCVKVYLVDSKEDPPSNLKNNTNKNCTEHKQERPKSVLFCYLKQTK